MYEKATIGSSGLPQLNAPIGTPRPWRVYQDVALAQGSILTKSSVSWRHGTRSFSDPSRIDFSQIVHKRISTLFVLLEPRVVRNL